MSVVIGIDEVGRGAWAGPLVVGAVGLSIDIPGLTDSKKIIKEKREELDILIRRTASFIGLGWVTAPEIDDLGLTKATTLACERAIEGLSPAAPIIIDGKVNFLPNRKNCKTLIGGDSLEPAVSAASIVAKVARDRFMTEQDRLFKGYGFATNVGYGTGFHHQAIRSLGLTPIHRWSYKPIQAILREYEA